MMPRLEADDQLDRMNAAAYPHMEQADARSYARSVEAATGRPTRVVRPMTAADIGALGITVVKNEPNGGEESDV